MQPPTYTPARSVPSATFRIWARPAKAHMHFDDDDDEGFKLLHLLSSHAVASRWPFRHTGCTHKPS
eukprot:1158192-Pelagomonas_calceolata.AAC.3